MSNISLWIYLFDVVGNLLHGLNIAMMAGATVLCAIAIYNFIGGASDTLEAGVADKMKKIIRLLAIFLIVVAPIRIAIPSQKTIAAMIVVPAIVNNEDIQGITSNSLKGLRLLAEDWLKRLMKEESDNE